MEEGAEQSFTFRCGDGGRKMENDRRKNVSRMKRGSEGETGEGRECGGRGIKIDGEVRKRRKRRERQREQTNQERRREKRLKRRRSRPEGGARAARWNRRPDDAESPPKTKMAATIPPFPHPRLERRHLVLVMSPGTAG